MRAIGLDVHRDFCEVAIAEGGEVRSAGRIETTPEALELFAGSLGRDDRVVLEVTGNAFEIARMVEPHVAQVIVVSPSDTGIRQARAKTDRLDARTLAKLLAAGALEGLWLPDERIRALRRRLQRRSRLVRASTRAKNEVHGALIRRLVSKPKVSDLSGWRVDAASRASSCPRRSARRSTARCARWTSSSRSSPRWSGRSPKMPSRRSRSAG